MNFKASEMLLKKAEEKGHRIGEVSGYPQWVVYRPMIGHLPLTFDGGVICATINALFLSDKAIEKAAKFFNTYLIQDDLCVLMIQKGQNLTLVGGACDLHLERVSDDEFSIVGLDSTKSARVREIKEEIGGEAAEAIISLLDKAPNFYLRGDKPHVYDNGDAVFPGSDIAVVNVNNLGEEISRVIEGEDPSEEGGLMAVPIRLALEHEGTFYLHKEFLQRWRGRSYGVLE